MLVNIYHLIKEDVETETKMIFNNYMKKLNKALTTFIRVKNRREFFHKLNNVKTILLMY